MAVEYAREGSVGYITLDNPPANSYDLSFMEELSECVRSAAEDDGAGAVILRSGSQRFFSAGADIKAFDANSVEDNMRMINQAHDGLSEIASTPKVFIAQIGAAALGGGLEMALACDLRFGAEGEYVLGLPEATLGLLPGNGGTQRLPPASLRTCGSPLPERRQGTADRGFRPRGPQKVRSSVPSP